MKYIFILIACLISTLLSSQVSVFASSADCNAGDISAITFLRNCGQGTSGIQPDIGGKTGIQNRVKIIAESAISFGALIAVAILVWSGIQYTLSYGEDEKIKHAKSTAINALIGLILLMASFGLVDVFLNFIFTLA